MEGNHSLEEGRQMEGNHSMEEERQMEGSLSAGGEANGRETLKKGWNGASGRASLKEGRKGGKWMGMTHGEEEGYVRETFESIQGKNFQ
jgi:hypothetical protein